MGGLTVPMSFLVIDKLGYDVIIGIDLLQATEAVIDAKSNTLVLFDGLTMIPMTKTGDHLVVKTTSSITVAPFTEAIVAVNCVGRPPMRDYIIEGGLQAPCRSLLVARSLVDVSRATYPCRVMNPTERPVTLRAKTAIGVLAPVTVQEQEFKKKNSSNQPRLSIADMRAA